MTSFNISANSSFAELVVENHKDPQWVKMIQSLVNYKKQLEDEEVETNNKIPIWNIYDSIEVLLEKYTPETINGTQYIRLTHLKSVLNNSKILDRDVEFIRRYNYVKLLTVAKWICEKNPKIKKSFLKNYNVCVGV